MLFVADEGLQVTFDRILNNEKKWINVRFGIGSRKKGKQTLYFLQFWIFFETVIEKPENVMWPPNDIYFY